MTTLIAEFTPVASLQAGQRIRYGGGDYQVAEVLPVAVLSGHVVVAHAGGNLDERVTLIYAVEDALAELAGGV